jgi:hypothetical protein
MKWEVVALGMHISAISLHLNFVSWAHVLVWITFAINLIYWIFYIVYLPQVHRETVGSSRTHLIWRSCVGIGSMGFLFSITLYSLCILNYNKILVLVFVWSLLVMMAMAIAHFIYDQKVYRAYINRMLCIFVGSVLILQFTLLDLVRWQYRNYPNFIHTFEFYQLDPGNQILKDHVVLEQMRIFLPSDQFEKYEKEHLRPMRRSNQW